VGHWMKTTLGRPSDQGRTGMWNLPGMGSDSGRARVSAPLWGWGLLWGETEFNRTTVHSGPTLPRKRLLTTVTTSSQVALETLHRGRKSWGTVAQQQVVASLPPSSEASHLEPSRQPPCTLPACTGKSGSEERAWD
jgi:hypothetical protein